MPVLSLAVELSFDDSLMNSHKFYRAVLAENHIAIAYGRQYTAGSTAEHTLATFELANAKFWSLLRDKAGKGYCVVDAVVYEEVPDLADQLANTTNGHRWRISSALLEQWKNLANERRRSGLGANQPQPDWENRVVSPRTASAGKTIVEALRDPMCPDDILLDCAMAAQSERFLWPMALSHPNCPDEARVARALVGLASSF